MALSTFKIRIVLFIGTPFYLSYIIHFLPSRTIQVWYPYTKAAEFRIVSGFQNTQETGCTNPRCVVAVAHMLHTAGAYYWQHKYFNINIFISSNAQSINRYKRRKKFLSPTYFPMYFV
jgi:hypothetical protein